MENKIESVCKKPYGTCCAKEKSRPVLVCVYVEMGYRLIWYTLRSMYEVCRIDFIGVSLNVFNFCVIFRNDIVTKMIIRLYNYMRSFNKTFIAY